MITILAGPNSYVRSRKQQELIDEFVSSYTDFGLERIDGEEANYDQIRESLESLPFLSAKKMVVLYSPSSNKQFLENYQTLIENLPDVTDVIIIEPKPDKRTGYFKYLKKQAGFTACEELDERQLVDWMMSEAKTLAGDISQSDSRYLLNRVGANQALMANEITKLINYDSQITKKTIDILTEASPSSTIFELIEAAFRGDSAKTMALYEEQRRLRVEPPQIIAMLGWQLHVVAVIAASAGEPDNAIASQAKISPFVVSKSRSLANKLGLAKTRQLVSRLAEIDEQSKTSQIDLETALKNYLLTIS